MPPDIDTPSLATVMLGFEGS